MSLFEENVKLFAATMPRPRFRGVTGRLDDDGSVNPNPAIGLDTGYVWVRMNNERTAVAVINTRITTQRANIPVIVEENDNGNLEVIGLDSEDAIFTYGSFAPALNMPDKPAEQEKGPVLHKRIKDLRLRLDSSGGLVLYLDKGIYEKTDTTLENWDGGTIDLTASLPGTVDTKRVVLVGLSSANAIVQSAATAVVTGTAPTTSPYFMLDDIVAAANAATSTTRWLWAVPLFNGQTSFLNVDDFVDLRPIVYGRGGVYNVTASSPLASSGGTAPNISLTGTVPVANGGTGQTSVTAAFNALSPLTSKGDVLGNDGTNDVRLAVGTNGQVLVADSTAASGLAWSSLPSTLEATLTTNDATTTNLIAYTVATTTAVTIRGRFVAAISDRSAAAGGFFRVTYRRTGAGDVTLVGAGYLELEEDSASAPTITFDVDVATQTGRIRWTGVAAQTWNVKCNYEVVSI